MEEDVVVVVSGVVVVAKGESPGNAAIPVGSR